jgi:hypothetical protein
MCSTNVCQGKILSNEILPLKAFTMLVLLLKPGPTITILVIDIFYRVSEIFYINIDSYPSYVEEIFYIAQKYPTFYFAHQQLEEKTRRVLTRALKQSRIPLDIL